MTVHSRQSPPAAGTNQVAVPRRDRGSVAVELALGVPLVVLLLFLLDAAAHLGRATIDVNSAAAAASRAASLSRTAAGAVTAARVAADANLAGHCAVLQVDVDTRSFHRGGAVTVNVACTITTHALTAIAIPGSVTTRGSSTSPIDLYRDVSLRPGTRPPIPRLDPNGGDPP